ncbi:MAG: hypothetical protein R3C68_01640 [Myxococcota bacterium]
MRHILGILTPIVGLIVLCPTLGLAADYYVATTGDNANSGTIGSPFRTLEKAASVMSAGDTMFIRGEPTNVPPGI